MPKSLISLLLSILLTIAASATVITSTTIIQGADGQPFNGTITFTLNAPAVDTTNHRTIVPYPIPMPVVNGLIAAPYNTLVGNDILSPTNTQYYALYKDAYGAPDAVYVYSVSGSTYDLGSAVPSPITTNNISYIDLLGLRSLSVTGLSTFSNILVIGPGSSASLIKVSAAGGANLVSSFKLGTSQRTSIFTNSSGVGTVEAYDDAASSIPLQIQPAGGNVNIGAGPVFAVTNNGIGNTKGHQDVRVASCNTGAGANANCPTTVTWPIQFADTNYTAICMLDNATGTPFILNSGAKTVSNFAVVISNGPGGGVSNGTLNCMAEHDQ